MRYLVHYEGSGEGCDYTIGCNHAVSFVDAESMDDAIKRITGGFLSYPEGRDSWYDPEELDKVTIYEVAQELSFDLDHINELRWMKGARAERERREREELAMYERLKEKFGQE